MLRNVMSRNVYLSLALGQLYRAGPTGRQHQAQVVQAAQPSKKANQSFKRHITACLRVANSIDGQTHFRCKALTCQIQVEPGVPQTFAERSLNGTVVLIINTHNYEYNHVY